VKRRMQRNLVLLFFCCSAVPMALLAGIGYYIANRTIVSMLRRQTGFSCLEVEERFAHELQRLQDHFRLTARGAATIPAGWESRGRFRDGRIEFYVDDLRAPGAAAEIFSGLVLLDTAGQPLYKIDYQSGQLRTGLDEQYFVQTVNFRPEDTRGYEEAVDLEPDKLAVKHPDPEAGTMMLRLAMPLDSDGQRVGVLLGDVDASTILESMIAGMSLGKDTFHFLVDSRSQVVLSHPDFSKRNQLLSVALPGLAEEVSGGLDDGWGRYHDGDGGDRLFSYRLLEGTPWIVVVAAPLGTFLAPIRQVGLFSLLVVIVVLSAASPAVVLLTRHFRRSLAALTESAEAFSAGRLDWRVNVNSDDEMGALAGAFNEMAGDLEGQIARREETARLESFNRLSAAVAHDLKGSLFSLSLLVENLERHRDDPEFQRDSAITIRNAVEKMKRTTEKLVDRRERTELRPERVDVSSLLHDLLRDSGITDHPGLRVERGLEPGVEIWADSGEVERLFLNLLHNAVEAMPDGGTLRLACRRFSEGDGPGCWTEIQVQDSGVGMTPEFVSTKLFRPFSSTKGKGLGLGLYTCKEIVDRHAGRIEVESEPGGGTLFSVYLREPETMDGARPSDTGRAARD